MQKNGKTPKCLPGVPAVCGKWKKEGNSAKDRQWAKEKQNGQEQGKAVSIHSVFEK